MVHALRRLTLTGALVEDRAEEARADFANLAIILYPHAPLTDRMWQLRHSVTAYDAAFAALAEALGVSPGDDGRASSSGIRCRRSDRVVQQPGDHRILDGADAGFLTTVKELEEWGPSSRPRVVAVGRLVADEGALRTAKGSRLTFSQRPRQLIPAQHDDRAEGLDCQTVLRGERAEVATAAHHAYEGLKRDGHRLILSKRRCGHLLSQAARVDPAGASRRPHLPPGGGPARVTPPVGSRRVRPVPAQPPPAQTVSDSAAL